MSQIITERVRTSRRTLLKGLTAAGARIAIGLPPLASMFNSIGTAYAATPDKRAFARQAAEETMVLLKNGKEFTLTRGVREIRQRLEAL